MNRYHKPASAGNGEALPNSAAFASFGALTLAGAAIHRRTRRPIPTCNLLAALAGLGAREVQ